MALTKEQIKEAFNLFDADGSGTIDASEMSLVLKGLGFTENERDIHSMIKAIDTDGSGNVGYDEFEELVLRRMDKADSPEEIWKAYHLFDPKKTGRITFDELKRVALLEDPSIGDDEVHRVLTAVADYPDRGITFEEWKNVMNSLKSNKARRGL
ncbi:Caltractin [Diplonema papillatum]|nr:Caltractin [Diplonema papillatum]